MATALATHPELSGFDALAPVPLHHRRERERGYNQAEILAREIAAATGLPLLNVLDRPRSGVPAWRLDRIARRRELAAAFSVRLNSETLIAGRRILVIDDVAATGTTLEACAKVLRGAGAADAAGYAFARSVA